MKVIELRNQSVGSRLVPQVGNGTEPVYEIAFEDKNTGDVIFIRFSKEVRDVIVRDLTGGIVLAGGELPNVRPQ